VSAIYPAHTLSYRAGRACWQCKRRCLEAMWTAPARERQGAEHAEQAGSRHELAEFTVLSPLEYHEANGDGWEWDQLHRRRRLRLGAAIAPGAACWGMTS